MSYWFEADDFDEFPEFYLQVHRAKMKNLETESYASVGRSIVNTINWLIQRSEITYHRDKRVYPQEDYIYARVSIDHEVFCMRADKYLEKYGMDYPEYLV